MPEDRASEHSRLKNAVFCTLKAGFFFLCFVFEQQRSIMIPAHRSASSAEQRRAASCGAVLCGAVPCCAVLRAVLYFLFRTRQVSFDEV